MEQRVKNPAAQSLGRLGGAAKSDAKAAAARRNGKRGGRPKKVAETKPACALRNARSIKLASRKGP